MRRYEPQPGERKSAHWRLSTYPTLLDRMRRAAYAERRSLNDSLGLAMEMWANQVERHHGGRLPDLPEQGLPVGRPKKQRETPDSTEERQQPKPDPATQDLLSRYRNREED